MTGGASSQQGHSREGTLPNIDRVVLRKVESVRISPHTSLLTAAYALLPAPTTQCVHISPHTSPLTAAYSPLLLHSMQCPFKHVNLSPHTSHLCLSLPSKCSSFCEMLLTSSPLSRAVLSSPQPFMEQPPTTRKSPCAPPLLRLPVLPRISSL